MSNYCTAEDVQVRLGLDNAYDTTSRPTLTQVNQVITEITAEIDMYLSKVGISSQPTDATVLSYLKAKCSAGSACRIGMAYMRNAQTVDNTQPSFYCEEYAKFLDDIESKDLFTIAGADDNYLESNVTDGTFTESEAESFFFESEDFTP